MGIKEKLQKWCAELTWQRAFSYIITGFLLCLFALFFDWLILNWISGCCEGGICIPDIYPQCRNELSDKFYGRRP